jgi:TRAP-type C4-dicarboxylate transport system permease small subunit
VLRKVKQAIGLVLLILFFTLIGTFVFLGAVSRIAGKEFNWTAAFFTYVFIGLALTGAHFWSHISAKARKR